MSDNRTYEMQWDCQFCGSKNLLGLTHRFCPNCGAPQNPDARYYPSDEDKVAVEDHQFVGVDVTCGSCGELNSAASQYCEQCGAPLTEAAKAKTLDSQVRAAGEQFQSSGSRDVVKEKFDAEMERIGVKKKPAEKKANWRGIAIVGVVIALIAGAVGFFFSTSEERLLVVEHSWEREISIDRYESFSVRDWRDSPPAGDSVSIVLGSCREEQRSTRRVDTGRDECRTVRTDNGDGTFTEREECTDIYRNEPVYDDMCTWEGNRWERHRTVQTSGDSLRDTPQWGDVNLDCAGQRRVGCERESGRSEQYTVHFRGDDKEAACNFSQDEWEAIPIESVWTAEVRARGMGPVVCESLERTN